MSSICCRLSNSLYDSIKIQVAQRNITTNDYTSKGTWTWIWLALRVYTIVCSVLAAYLANTNLLAIWERWDTVYYSRIASVGYSVTDGTTTFHPLFPWLAKPLSLL